MSFQDGYMTSTVVSAHLDALATKYTTICTRSITTEWSPGRAGGASGFVKIANPAGSTDPRWAVLLTGGVHARELAPPDALVSFLEKLLTAYSAQSPITYPAWVDPVDNVRYDSFTISWPWVQTVVDRLDLYVAPLVNPDGRDFVLTRLPTTATAAEQALHKGWRKNRRPAPAGKTDPRSIGVDINRNFDILWKFGKFYSATAGVQSSTDSLSEMYTGDGAEAEPETQNVAELMRSKNISWYMDYHAYGRDVLFPWGIESNQSVDATMNFANSAWDGKRDGTAVATYKEYIPKATEDDAKALAKRICEFILIACGGSDTTAQLRSEYRPLLAANMYVTSGTTQDYCFSRWFTAATQGNPIAPVMAYTLEVGGDPKLGANHQEGGFTPDYVKHYPKIEREIHVATFAFLTAIAARAVATPAAPAPPGSSSTLGGSGSSGGNP
jgi:Zinc carboxypeptidase